MFRVHLLAIVLAVAFVLCTQFSALAGSPGQIPAGWLPFLGGGEGAPYATPSDPPGPIPSAFLPFLGGQEGQVGAAPAVGTIPSAWLPFLGGGEGVPDPTPAP